MGKKTKIKTAKTSAMLAKDVDCRRAANCLCYCIWVFLGPKEPATNIVVDGTDTCHRSRPKMGVVHCNDRALSKLLFFFFFFCL